MNKIVDMLRANPARFSEVVAEVRKEITDSVMSSATTDEERAGFLAEYHALDRVINRLGSQAL